MSNYPQLHSSSQFIYQQPAHSLRSHRVAAPMEEDNQSVTIKLESKHQLLAEELDTPA